MRRALPSRDGSVGFIDQVFDERCSSADPGHPRDEVPASTRSTSACARLDGTTLPEPQRPRAAQAVPKQPITIRAPPSHFLGKSPREMGHEKGPRSAFPQLTGPKLCKMVVPRKDVNLSIRSQMLYPLSYGRSFNYSPWSRVLMRPRGRGCVSAGPRVLLLPGPARNDSSMPPSGARVPVGAA